MKKITHALFLLLLTTACQQTADRHAQRIVVTGIDSSKKPGDDFFKADAEHLESLLCQTA